MEDYLDYVKISNFCFQKVTEIILFAQIFGILWVITGEETQPESGRIFVLCAIFATSYTAGEICTFLNLPPLLGMLVGGLVIRNTSNITVHGPTSTLLRRLALATILLRAGLGLNPTALRKLSAVCFRLAFTPCLIETITTATTAKYLGGIPIQWGAMLGFTVAAVSPAVVVKSMLSLKEKRLGTDKGIPTLVIAAASMDDVLAITGYGIAFGFAFSQESQTVAMELLKAPLEVAFGILIGTTVGFVLWLFPFSYDTDKETNALEGRQRLLLTIFFGMFMLLLGAKYEVQGVGALGSLTMTFVAAMSWRKKKHDLSVDFGLKILWNLFEPFLFGLIGAEVIITNLTLSSVTFSLVSLAIGLVMRCATVIVVCSGTDFNFKEKLFVSLAWLPKATVQAALGSVALDKVREMQEEGDVAKEYFDYGTLILNYAVISIFVTAPLGALMIAVTAPILLSKEEIEKQKSGSKIVIPDY
ncbi:hypothetical protein B4U79_05953 [Dinothrombium tinctorium]|uniref:Cation/H+ exchanger transmembrane domain-containing protein n=1 Tax=Dinothrombium tinctorium TaxID=1965070 RepID=A0A443QJS7_9ACAR|nr:hypothetical protein B4U79_05953 [Dinothrombium tinctorium]